MEIVLKLLTGSNAGREIPVPPPGCVVGREEGCELRINSKHVSRRHCQLTIEDGCLWVRDLKSSNGTFVNGERIEECQLRSGDVLRLGKYEFQAVIPQCEQEAEESAWDKFCKEIESIDTEIRPLPSSELRTVSWPAPVSADRAKEHSEEETRQGVAEEETRHTPTDVETRETEKDAANDAGEVPGKPRFEVKRPTDPDSQSAAREALRRYFRPQ